MKISKNMFPLIISILCISIHACASQQEQNIELTEFGFSNSTKMQNTPLIASHVQNNPSYWKRKIGIGLLTIALIGGISFGIDWNPKKTPIPEYNFPKGEGPFGRCNAIRFNDHQSTEDNAIRSIFPTCNLLNSSSKGLSSCPSYVTIHFLDFSKWPPCREMYRTHCITDQQIEINVPKFCKHYYGDKDTRKSSTLIKMQQINNTTRKKMTSAERKHRQRVMARK